MPRADSPRQEILLLYAKLCTAWIYGCKTNTFVLCCRAARCCRVLLLDEVLAPDTIADEGVDDTELLQNALSLAQQRAAQLRLVIVLLPDIDLAVQQQQPARVHESAGGMSVGYGGGGAVSTSVTNSASEGCSGGTVAAGGGGGGGGSYMPGSGMTGDVTGLAAAAHRAAADARPKRINAMIIKVFREQLEKANEQGTVLAGTMRQVLLLLEAVVGKLPAGSAAAAAGVSVKLEGSLATQQRSAARQLG
jgi:hypothetical protein